MKLACAFMLMRTLIHFAKCLGAYESTRSLPYISAFLSNMVSAKPLNRNWWSLNSTNKRVGKSTSRSQHSLRRTKCLRCCKLFLHRPYCNIYLEFDFMSIVNHRRQSSLVQRLISSCSEPKLDLLPGSGPDKNSHAAHFTYILSKQTRAFFLPPLSFTLDVEVCFSRTGCEHGTKKSKTNRTRNTLHNCAS